MFRDSASRLIHSIAWLLLPLGAVGQNWEPLPLVTEEVLRSGIRGGEGCQWPQAIAVDSSGRKLLLATDVGGIYRSGDGGNTWEPSNTGLDARGGCSIAFDPGNSSRVLLVAGNSLEQPFHGIYLSNDGGVSWRSVLPFDNLGYRDMREQIVFDPATYNSAESRTELAFWSAAKTKSREAGFFKSSDGGETWQEVPGIGREIGSNILKVHPDRGWIFAAGEKGLFRSQDHGKSFVKVFAEPVTGLDLVLTRPDTLAICTARAMFISANGGDTFDAMVGKSFPPSGRSGLKRLHVSPANPDYMIVENDEGEWQRERYITQDGGATWRKASTNVSRSFIPNNNRPMIVAWHPKEANIAWAIGGDFMTRSSDGGIHWQWSNSGYTGIMVGHSFQFNATDNNLLYLPSQDYDGAVSGDAGSSWRYFGISGEKWGGYTYGGYAFAADHIAGGSRTGWGGKTELRTNYQGKLMKTGIELNGIPTGAGDPLDSSIVFLHNFRTSDTGKTWKPMPDCDGVLTFNAANPAQLFGAKGHTVLMSSDHGVSWSPICTIPKGNVRDVAFDGRSHHLYIAASDAQLYRFATESAALENITGSLLADQFGRRGAHSVAIDPREPSIVYVVQPGNKYLKDTSVLRSTDRGRSWTCLTRSLRLRTGLDGPDGGREATWVRVHPVTRNAYVATNCFGLWRIGPPLDRPPE